MEKKTLGIIGGVGPLATMQIGEMIVRKTVAEKDQDHVNMVITNNTTIPDRTAFILGESEKSPVPYIVKDMHKLAQAGAEVLIIPCNTAHSFYEDLVAESPIPVINMIDETVQAVQRRGAKRIGILATSGTISTCIYQDACDRFGVEAIIPNEKTQQLVMSLIYEDVKAGRPASKEKWLLIDEAMQEAACDVLILGCTELAIVQQELGLTNCVDSLTVLAEVAIEKCGYQLKNV